MASYLKGQNFRVFLKEADAFKAIAGATSCSVHLAANLEETSTKDSTEDWQEQEVVSKQWDGSVDALVILDDSSAIGGLSVIDLIGTTVDIEFQETTGTDKNRSPKASGVKYTGKAIVNDISQTHGNKANSTFTMQFTGVGKLEKGAIA